MGATEWPVTLIMAGEVILALCQLQSVFWRTEVINTTRPENLY